MHNVKFMLICWKVNFHQIPYMPKYASQNSEKGSLKCILLKKNIKDKTKMFTWSSPDPLCRWDRWPSTCWTWPSPPMILCALFPPWWPLQQFVWPGKSWSLTSPAGLLDCPTFPAMPRKILFHAWKKWWTF